MCDIETDQKRKKGLADIRLDAVQLTRQIDVDNFIYYEFVNEWIEWEREKTVLNRVRIIIFENYGLNINSIKWFESEKKTSIKLHKKKTAAANKVLVI